MKYLILFLIIFLSGCIQLDTWENGIISYRLKEFTEEEEIKIRMAMDEWESVANITFTIEGQVGLTIKKSSSVNASTTGSGCYPFCLMRLKTTGHRIILHELGHTLGLIHEHCRMDRDDYIHIIWENIKEKEKHNFIQRKGLLNIYDFPYDYVSIMHYRSVYIFSKNMQPTIDFLGHIRVHPDGLTEEDKRKIKFLYPYTEE